MSATIPPAPTAASAYRAIEAHGRVQFLAGACVALRSGPTACERCVAACPVNSIQAHETGFTVGASCTGCGHCAAACPTGALSVKGFDNAEALPNGYTLRVECWKVPASACGSDALRVPCLGGVAPAQWLALCEAAGLGPLVVLDRGWCGQCHARPKAASGHPAEPALGQVWPILAALDWPQARQPRIHADPLPLRLMPADIPSDRPPSLARRAFFRRLCVEAKRAVGTDVPVTRPTPRGLKAHALLMPQRDQLLAIAKRLSRAAKRALPPALYQTLSVSPACDHNAVCAGVCPSGALTLFEGAASVGLAFDAERCIDCGHCARSCPQHAICLQPSATAPVQGGAQQVTTHGQTTCQICRQAFYGAAHNSTCPSCLRNRQMGASLFGTVLAYNKP